MDDKRFGPLPTSVEAALAEIEELQRQISQVEQELIFADHEEDEVEAAALVAAGDATSCDPAASSAAPASAAPSDADGAAAGAAAGTPTKASKPVDAEELRAAGATVSDVVDEVHDWLPPLKCVPICADVRTFDFKVRCLLRARLWFTSVVVSTTP